MANLVVIGATGDVGRGIVAVLLAEGHEVAAVARNLARLEALRQELGAPAGLHIVRGSLSDDAGGAKLLEAVRAVHSTIDGVAVAINAPRERADLLAVGSDRFSGFLASDLVAHFTAAKTFVPALPPGGTYVGIGGGSADFILEGGAHMSVAQAGLRMLHRGLAFEAEPLGVHLKQLTVASVVNGATTRAHADPAWVTAEEIGAQVAAMIARPGEFPEPVWRIARRDASGRPVVTHEGSTLAINRPLVESDLGVAGVVNN